MLMDRWEDARSYMFLLLLEVRPPGIRRNRRRLNAVSPSLVGRSKSRELRRMTRPCPVRMMILRRRMFRWMRPCSA